MVVVRSGTVQLSIARGWIMSCYVMSVMNQFVVYEGTCDS